MDGCMRILGVSEIIFDDHSNIRTFESKQRDCSSYFRPILTEKESKDLCDIALRSCEIMGCNNYARLDFRKEESGELFLLEINANPDISPESSVMFHVQQSGKTFRDLIEIIVNSAMRRKNEHKSYYNITD
jgi:D-alanine-D-alanine ligase